MRPFGSLISIDEARRRLTASIRPISRTERVNLSEAVDRVAAANVVSSVHVPPFARSAMDGYAVRAADTSGASPSEPISLSVVERIYTGQTPQHAIAPGSSAEIATGAPLPDGADAVVMVEQTSPSDQGRVSITARVEAGQNIGPRGADITPGDIVVRQGDQLTASRIGALAAIGCADIEVYAKPRVAILSTGNEVVPPGAPLAGGQIYDVNRFTLAAVVAQHGGVADHRPPVPDSIDQIGHALDECADADIVIFSGGSSVGERDLIIDAISGRGVVVFHGIAVKPGKPTAFAIVRGRPFFGMPGNPTSCLSNAYILLVPFLRAAARLPVFEPRTVRVPLGRRLVSQAGRHQFYTVRVRDGAAFPAFKGSGEITSLSQADGYIEIPANQDTVEEGTIVEVTLF
jgi:molybdenum cofactor synthesis domain-containing protein